MDQQWIKNIVPAILTNKIGLPISFFLDETKYTLIRFPKTLDNLWESQGGSMVNGAPREFPKSTQCTP